MITIANIERARELLRGVIVETPVLPCARLSEESGARVFVKAENTQRAGSFKLRGAYTKLSKLTPSQRRRGVIAASMGNHAQGVALGAQLLDIDATVVMPIEAPLTKVTATRRYGARVVLHGNSFDDAVAHARELEQTQGLTLVHAFDDPEVIAGQGVLGLELLDALPEVDTVVVPIGGGGLISGVASALRARRPSVRIVGVQAARCATVHPSLAAGEPVAVESARTIADGIAVKRPGGLTIPIIRDLVETVVTVDEDEIARAIVYTLDNMGLLVEGAGAVGVAALLNRTVQVRPGECVCIVLSGANIDANLLTRVIDQTLTQDGRYLVIRTSVPDRPGHLAQLAGEIAAAGANVVDIHHRRSVWGVPLDHTGLELILEVRDADHGQAVLDRLSAAGYVTTRVVPGRFLAST
jgi:threonine dehydratase